MSFTPTEIAAETSIFLNLRLPMNLTSSNSWQLACKHWWQ
jgi:hypothetical protein